MIAKSMRKLVMIPFCSCTIFVVNIYFIYTHFFLPHLNILFTLILLYISTF